MGGETIGTIQVIATINTKDYDAAKKKIENGNKSLEKSNSSADDSFAKLASGVAKATAAASIAIGAMFIAAVKSAANLEQSLGGSEVVFDNYADTIQKKAKESAFVMGTSMNQYLETANRMGSLFQGAGFSVKKSLDLTIEAMQRATDVATAMGISTDMALESIAGAAKGNFTMMDNLGVAMNDTTLEAYRLAKGLDKAVTKMTTSEKVGLAMQLFMERTAKFAGNYARENATLAGSFQTLRGAWGNFMAGVEGSDKQLALALSNMVKVLAAALPPIAAQLGSAISSLMKEFLDTTGITPFIDLIKSIAIVISSLLLPAIVKYIALQIKAGVVALAAGARMFAAWTLALGPIGLLAAAVIALTALIITNSKTVGKIFGQVWQGMVNYAVRSVGMIIKAVSTVLKPLIAPFSAAFGNIKTLFSGMAPWFSGLWSRVTGIFKAAGNAIGNAVGGAFKAAINGAITMVQNALNAPINAINGAIGQINKLPGVDIGKIPTLNLPKLAKGGIVSSATIAMIGEGSEPEAVIPLSKLDKMLDGDGGGAKTEYNIQSITISSEVDGERWLRRLTDNQEIVSSGLTPQQRYM